MTGNVRRTVSAFLLVVALVVGCRPATSLPSVTVTFSSPQGVTSEPFITEVAATPETRTKGLMFRDSLGAREGMLFLFPQQQRLSFWMKNTLIPLDMVFVGADWTVVGVLENVPPLTEAPRFIDANSQYVLEFKAGTAQKVGIVKGSAVRVRGQLPSIQ